MKTPEITEWVTELDRAYGLIRAARTAGARDGAVADIEEALGALATLHDRMLRAEIRSVISKSSQTEVA